MAGLMKRLVTAQVVVEEHAAGRRRLVAPRAQSLITPEAWSKAHELGVVLEQDEPAEHASCAREVDASGVVVVRGKSVILGDFAGAGPGKKVGLADVITSRDGSPMTAGIMSWNREDSFPWTLDYDEVDLVLEGVLHVTVDGRTVEGHPGDVLYIPKGRRIIFGTPSRTQVFYVTYPADWSTASPIRPHR